MLELILIAGISAFLSGMGIGGGSLFVMLGTIFLQYDQKEAQFINLIMFLTVGMSATYSNFKKQKVEKNILLKILPVAIIGSIIGTRVMRNIQSDTLKIYFSIFMAIIGVYEIISSLNKNKTANNKNKS